MCLIALSVFCLRPLISCIRLLLESQHLQPIIFMHGWIGYLCPSVKVTDCNLAELGIYLALSKSNLRSDYSESYAYNFICRRFITFYDKILIRKLIFHAPSSQIAFTKSWLNGCILFLYYRLPITFFFKLSLFTC